MQIVASTGSRGDEAAKRMGEARAESGTEGTLTSPGGDEKCAAVRRRGKIPMRSTEDRPNAYCYSGPLQTLQ